jgi:hypothetical protein
MRTVFVREDGDFIFIPTKATNPSTSMPKKVIQNVQKGNSECKYWLDVELYDIHEAYAYNLSRWDTREVRKIILQHFDES